MATPKSRLFVLIVVPALILLLPLTVYVIDSAAASDKVARNVTIAGIDVSRVSEAEARSAVDQYVDEHMNVTATVSIDGAEFTYAPADVGLSFDVDSALEAAMDQYKDGVGEWFRAFSEPVDIPLTASIDEDMLADRIHEWELAAIENPAFEGEIEILNQRARVTYPATGEAVDRDVAADEILSALASGSEDVVVLPTVAAQPVHTADQLDAAATQAESMIRRGVTLTNDTYDFTFTVPPFSLALALDVDVATDGSDDITFGLDDTVIVPLIERARPSLEIPPVDATWKTTVVDDTEDVDENYAIPEKEIRRPPGVDGNPLDDTIELVPSLNGTRVDVTDVLEAVEAAAFDGGTGYLPITQDAEPEFTTEDAEAYGELYEVSEFTTRMPGTNRVHNIQLMADLVDGTVVWPGETFSVNEHVGKRTLEKGFKYDCAIVSGELSCEEDPVNVGGGVSQFGTTIFNAIYFGCYKDVTHQPHSIYFSKYPEGREATLGYPLPDVAFENDSNAPVIIRTSYTSHSITITFFGNQEGMTCGTERSDRSNVTSPVLEYQADEEGRVDPGEEFVKSKGSKGWSVTNTRIFYAPDGTELKRENFFWRYRGEKNVILLHPCDPRVGGDGQCPIQVPSVRGMPEGDAASALTSAGFAVAVTSVDTSDPAQDGVVIDVAPTGWQDEGTTITITVAHYNGEPPPSDG